MTKQSKTALNETLAPFFNQSIDCLCIANYDGYFVDINPGLVALLGYSVEELKSKKISEFIYAEDRELTAAKRQKLLDNVPLVNFENRYVSKSGRLIWLHWTSLPLPGEGLIYAIAKDITHKKKLQKEQLSHLSELSIANRELQQLNYTTSHDLRSPINNLISLVNLIDLEKISDTETKEILAMIKVSSNGLIDTMNSNIDAFKKKDRAQKQLSQTNLMEVLNKVRHSIGSLIKQSDTRFNIDFSALNVVWFTPKALESVFLNFITNSIKYSKSGVSPIITICSKKENGKSILMYKDNGIGFDMKKIGHQLFKLNEGFHGESNSKGVGLYLVYQKVTGHGGSIKVDSEVNKGTTFSITFKEHLN
ncbi:MAG: PAS domain-containing sensor histidine kinase [Flavobacteriaceae bacterium]|nr:PAS domain-containing sensor histidine kinase [Flavobacteriaceae bacterium]